MHSSQGLALRVRRSRSVGRAARAAQLGLLAPRSCTAAASSPRQCLILSLHTWPIELCNSPIDMHNQRAKEGGNSQGSSIGAEDPNLRSAAQLATSAAQAAAGRPISAWLVHVAMQCCYPWLSHAYIELGGGG